jgi:L-ascorbate metabolism protein UlaG (beta-lactamase superfamily)
MADESVRRRVTWLGHSSVVLELGNARLLTDPLLRSRVAFLRRHGAPAELPEGVDAVLLSHMHRDHADLPSLRRLPSGTLVIAPVGSGAILRGLNVREVDVGDTVEVAGVEIAVVQAVHGGTRNPGGRALPALGFVADGVYFAGDTDMFEGMADLGPLATALLPIWGWGPALGPGHLDPEEAARALSLLNPELVVPIHWGTLLAAGFGRRHAHLLREPVDDFLRHARRLAPNVEVWVPSVGEPIEVPAVAGGLDV